MTDNEDKGAVLSFLAGIGVGAIVGSAIALLVAPQTGEETREDLKKVVQDLSKSTEELRKRSMDLLDTAKSKAVQTYEASREAMRKTGEETGDATTEEA